MCSNAPVRTVTPDAIVTHWSAEGNCGVIEGGQAHGPASKGGVGPTAFCSKAVGAVLIEGSGTAPRLRPPILLMILLENIARTLPP